MKRRSAFVILGAFAGLLGGVMPVGRAVAVGSLAEVSIIDRETGSVLTPHFYRGEYWVAGTPGARYAIEVRNHTGGRLLAVTSVDGVNILSGDTAGWDQGGYVFGAGESYQLTGWRKTDAEVAAFAFTPSPNSYASRTGRPANVGVIGVALFRERAVPIPVPPPLSRLQEWDKAQSAARVDGGVGAASPAPAQAPAGSDSMRERANGVPSDGALARRAPLQKLGTAHGERESSYTTHTVFERQESTPNEVITVHYDSLENLVAMGVVPTRRPVQHRPAAFPGSPSFDYVPDPPG